MDLGLEGKVAIVTGGGRGIGAACSKLLAKEGAAVVVNYTQDEAAAKNIVEQITAGEGKAITFKADVSCPEEVNAMADVALETFGQIDILVNNAGISTHTRTIAETTPEDIEKCMAVNVNGLLNCTKAVVDYMKERRYGKIVNIVSYRAYAPQLPSPYGLTKGAALIFSIETAKELAPYNINVVSISPGMIMTDMLRERKKANEAVFQQMVEQIPLGRVGEPEDVANLVCFLASECSRHITGTDILITGGEMCRW